MTKIKVNIQSTDRLNKREIGIWDTITDTIKCVCNRVFKRKDVLQKGIIDYGVISNKKK